MRLTIALANPTEMPLNVDTGQMGKPQLQFNGAPVPLNTTPVTKRLAPGEGLTFACTATLPTSDAGQLTFINGPIIVTGPLPGEPT